MDAGDSRRCIKKRFDLWVSDSTVALHLHQMNLSCQKPCYQAQGQDPEKVAHFINNKFKLIQKLLKKSGPILHLRMKQV
ncbi:MAG: winged helix-turn-helix domain-containing protein [Candidatus Competibacteraceae bacterium]|nr:winged helix-turn-helix domain-containing protein [Candidatus Competibacteraceae bacterium]